MLNIGKGALEKSFRRLTFLKTSIDSHQFLGNFQVSAFCLSAIPVLLQLLLSSGIDLALSSLFQTPDLLQLQ